MANPILTPLLGARTADYCHMLGHYGMDCRFVLRVAGTLIASLLGVPFRWYEEQVVGPKIREAEISAPLFVLGFWRSGTTHLHNLLAQDPQFGFLDQYQAMFPHSAATNRIAYSLMRPFIPATRPIDNVRLSLDSPQEEELALAATGHSYYTGWYFPKMREELLKKYVTFEHTSSAEHQAWKSAYMLLLAKATYRFGGRQLVLKNPPNTARIPMLLELFPDAKFVHIVRDPYEVYHSAKRMFKLAWPHFAHHHVLTDFDAYTRELYRVIMSKYLQDRDKISSGNLVEVRYEELLADTSGILQDIYAQLSLHHFDEASPRFAKYLQGQKAYTPSSYERDRVHEQDLRDAWKQMYEAFNY